MNAERSTVTEKRIKVYTYTRVSTAMQIDGYSLDAQKARMKAFADFEAVCLLSKPGRQSSILL